MTPRPEVLAFDVNETLLDLSVLGPALDEALGSPGRLGEWFARTLHGSLVANATDRFRSFGSIAVEQLVVLSVKAGVDLGPRRAAEIVAGMRRLPAHPDVVPSLESLREAGFRMVTLTNGSTDAVAEQLESSGLAAFFARSISVDEIGRFKPAPEVYVHTATVLDVDIDQVMLVAAHDWDVAGAMSVGMRAAYLDRPGAVWGLPQERPPTVAPDLRSLAAALAGGA